MQEKNNLLQDFEQYKKKHNEPKLLTHSFNLFEVTSTQN